MSQLLATTPLTLTVVVREGIPFVTAQPLEASTRGGGDGLSAVIQRLAVDRHPHDACAHRLADVEGVGAPPPAGGARDALLALAQGLGGT
ncbi:hypothetical protein ACN28E_32100 [Archangium lansingense]|uniref:hypothetical protein n=1 Tax=Archangium lansingense TaxID=2995310 RepID=UPI003B789BC2